MSILIVWRAFYQGAEVVEPEKLGAEVSFARGRSVFSWGAEVSWRGAEVFFQKGAEGAEVVGAEVVGAEVSNPLFNYLFTQRSSYNMFHNHD